MSDVKEETMGELAARLMKQYEPRIREADRATPQSVTAMSDREAVLHGLLRGLARGYVQPSFRPIIALAIYEIEKAPTHD